MSPKRWSFVWIAPLLGTLWTSAQALGRRPNQDADGFPDYNRLEYRKKLPDPVEQKPAPTPAPPVFTRPPLNASSVSPSEVDALPKPAPPAVPMRDTASEPPMPDDMISTLAAPATFQAAVQVSSPTH